MKDSVPCVKIQVNSQYVEEHSQPEADRYVFSYTITIHNFSQDGVQLQSRSWLITDANAKQMTVQGDGVVGEQPLILAGDSYTYTSGVALETPVGVMQGHYVMLDSESNEFKAVIDPFRLAIPNLLN